MTSSAIKASHSSLSLPNPLTTLIIVCCHAIWLGGPTAGRAESEWAIEPFQTGETETFAAHAEAGVQELIKEDGKGLLVFSGGVTKPSLTPISEAESYHSLIQARRTLPHNKAHLASHILTERQATDSLQNLLFSLLLFTQKTGYAPEYVVIISHAFKRARFLDLHSRTLRLARENVKFVGIDPPGLGPEVCEGDGEPCEARILAERGEQKARELWRKDWWGWGYELGEKRRKRGWSGGEETMHDIVRWQGGASRREDYPGQLPWE